MTVLPIILSLFCGLALFLYGMRQMSNALKSLAGNKLKETVQTTEENTTTEENSENANTESETTTENVAENTTVEVQE